MYDNNKKKLLINFLMLMIVGIMSVFIGMSLVSYNPCDPSWFYTTNKIVSVSNAGGVLGATCAAFLFYYGGGAAFLVIFFLLLMMYCVWRQRLIKNEWERFVAALIFMGACAALLTTYNVDVLVSPCPGGMCGLLLSQWLVRWFDEIERVLFLVVSLTASCVILFRCSFVVIVQEALRGINYIIDSAKRYEIVNYGAYGVRVVFYTLFIRPVLFVFDFIQSLLNGSAFDGTGLVIPEEDASIHLSIHCLDEVGSVAEGDVSKGDISDDKNLPCYTASTHDSIVAQPHNELSESSYALPHLDIFIYDKKNNDDHDLEEELANRAHILTDKLKRFGVSGDVVAIKRGPVVTLFEYQPDVDTKLSKIIALEDDLAMALQAMSIRILAPIPGRAVVGFEVANAKRNDVLFSQIIATPLYKNFSGSLPLVLGKGTIGETVVVDLARMPHLLIAGSTGSGKSVALNAILISLLCKLDPDTLKLILIDPKRLEFASFSDIAHLLFPIVTSPHHAAPVLKWVVNEMERRYEKMAEKGARNNIDYNASLSAQESASRLPSIVIIIDELADLMLTAGRDIEDLITRITQMARAAGIHMIVATQRPSVDVITGLIKANFPSRISFRVASRIDSRTILDTMGADRLLGRGDMLFLDAATSQLTRVHGAYVSDREIESVVNHIRSQRKVEYLDIQQEMRSFEQVGGSTNDPLYDEIRLFLDEVDEISISLVQRKFRIGYNRSARIIDILESQGLIMPQDGGKTRKVIR